MSNDSKAQAFKETARAYRAVFESEDGKKILQDLRAAFGYGKPSARAGMRNEEVWLAEGMKMPLRHIDRMRSLADREATPPAARR